MRFAKWVFACAGVYGLIVLTPFLFLERQIAAPAAGLEHPEYFYGFVFVAIAFQLVFLLISRDPARYRPIMLAAVVEKLPFAVTVPWLYLQHRTPLPPTLFAGVDFMWGVLFTIAYLRTPKAA